MALRPIGLTSQQFSTLTALKHLGDVSTTDLANVLGVERTTMTRNIDQMRKSKWLEAVVSEDHRVKAFKLTEKGSNLQAAALPLWSEQQRKLLGAIGQDTADGLIRLAKTA